MKVLRSEIKGFEQRTSLELPLYLSQIPAGFPSPADDYIDKNLDLNEFLIKHPAATFFVRAYGDSMRDAGIHSGDILIVDRALEPRNNSIVVAVVNGELTVKRLYQKENKLYLMPDNPRYKPLEITEDMDFEVWGVVTNVIHSLE
ncbi:translesion error-prone DNA polymerase V autoproteolytic subunit [Desulfohalobiaceae bacterium Ax17]|jgi:DNA polymerase V|uniref:LexA family protein n=1 Tax=Desulfovulcanus ferrireducens TaxID=2831190 RepID=UPI00207BB833|nr:translesion error-prone DNA polymerase V autoproteolytic subunit [Desulfovulcanus ferrireducens]MBT8763128.1 translesion error-prone DNA polymerase V autoproteolytic subunit [Desulfovulcanus ferrireducens]